MIAFLSRISERIGAGFDWLGSKIDQKVSKRRVSQRGAVKKMQRSSAKKRTDEVELAQCSRQKRNTYFGFGGGKQLEDSEGCGYTGCCKYFGLTAEKRQEQIAEFFCSNEQEPLKGSQPEQKEEKVILVDLPSLIN